MDFIIKKFNYFLVLFFILLVPLNYINKYYNYFIDIKYHEILWYFIPVLIFIYLYNVIKRKCKLDIFDYLIYILIILNVIVCIFAVDRSVSFYGNDVRNEGFLSFLSYYLVFLCCKHIDDRKDMKNILGLFCFVGVFQFILSAFQIYFNDILVLNNKYFFINMASGFINNPNFMASYIILLIGFILGKYLTCNKGIIWYFILSLIFYINLLFSQSTGPFLGFVCMVLFMLIFLIIKKKLKIWRYMVIVIAFILTYVGIEYSLKMFDSNEIVTGDSYSLNYDIKQLFRAATGQMVIYDMPEPEEDPDFNYITDKEVSDEDNLNGLGSGRIMIWRNSLKLVPDFYLTGAGIDCFGLVYKWHYDGVYYDKAHNDFLQTLITRGIFSLIVYLLFLLMLFIKGVRSKDTLVWGLLLSIVGYAAQSFTNISVVLVAPYFYMICGLFVALVNVKKDK